MNAEQIQRAVLAELKKVGAHVLRSTLYSLSQEPGEEDVQIPAYRNCFIFSMIMTRNDYMQFRDVINKKDIWLNTRFWPFDIGGDMFEYSCQAVQKY